MSIPAASKADRRRIAQDFKERKVPRGIFAVVCAGTGEKWIGASPNLAAVQNSLWFQLRSGLYRNTVLQQAWKTHGEAAFSVQTLEQFSDDTPSLLLNDLYLSKKREWASVLNCSLL